MQDILDLAHRLGKAIAAHPRYVTLQEARKKARSDAQASRLLKDFQEHARLIARKEAEQKPIEVDEKHKLADLQERIASHDLLKDLMRLQADFSEMMSRVNHAMAAPIADLEQPEPRAAADE
jgi:cell fate (sporulation/competence/biofilm development) regulator YlbF (YheA/YmcA/DUF963 family)